MADVDTIIVGAGTAGCLLARRLVERCGHAVLLVEAGPRYPAPVLDPPLAGMRLRGPWMDPLTTVPQPHLGGRSIECPVGRVVGGSSSVNAMMHVPGSPSVFDDWSASGSSGWSASEMAPYFAVTSGDAGLLPVVPPAFLAPFSAAFLDACAEDGLQRIPRLSGDSAGTCGPFWQFQRQGRRVGAARDILATSRRRDLLRVVTRRAVRRITIARGRATGVELADGTTIAARREVVVAAGVYRSPLLLQRSGIGPRDLLARAGITPVVDCPAVGEHLQDHPRVPVVYASGRRSPGHPSRWLLAAIRYLLRRDGVMVSNCCEVGAMLATTPGRSAPDVEIITHFQTVWASDAVDLECALLETTSRGTVRIDPADPWGRPVIDPRYLSHDREVETLAAGVVRARSIASRPALARFPLGAELFPGRDTDLPTELRRLVSTSHHPVGTCRMGSDADAVVDPRLRVRGVDGLRVVDASVMPRLPGGHPSATVFAIAERAAEFIGGE